MLQKDNQIYAVNIDGHGHDGYHGYKIPKKDAEYFRTIGFDIAQSNILENIDTDSIDFECKIYRIF